MASLAFAQSREQQPRRGGPGTGNPDEHRVPWKFLQTDALLKEQPNRYVAALEERIRAAGGHPWGVELAAGFSRDAALSLYARTLTRLAEVVADRDPIISSRVLRSRGTRPFYRVSIGADTRPEATALCAKIRAAGGACIVLRAS